MRCDLCGADAAQMRHVTRSFGRGDGSLSIENIPTCSAVDAGNATSRPPPCGRSSV